MEIQILNKKKTAIAPDMIGLFFEDINYAADGGLYAEMIENRSFEFVEAFGDKGDYFTKFDGGYGWDLYPADADASIDVVMGSPLYEENPHYLRLNAKSENAGFSNKAYSGIYLEKGMSYLVKFYARTIKGEGEFTVSIVKDGKVYASASAQMVKPRGIKPNHWEKYELTLTADSEVRNALFVIQMSTAGIAEFDFISMMPENAVAGVFRKDLFEMLESLHPGFIRFPGGCIVEGDTLANRYRYKDTLTVPEARRSNWNRWAVHGNKEENGFHSEFAHYNQTYGLGYYEYFVLCEKLKAKPLPVMNVGMACQYQSYEWYEIGTDEFNQFVQDAIDLITFANGSTDTKWGAVRAALGHPEPFGLEYLGIGNEQWQTEEADFFSRYEIFEKAIHEAYPDIKLIGSAGPAVNDEHYTAAWDFYQTHEKDENFVHAVDEHYYVKPQWLFDNNNFYDEYPRSRKVFAGEYAAHPEGGDNNLLGALSEAAFLTGVERNADVVILSSYAPLFARHDFRQWYPDLIWFDDKTSYGSPSFYVQKMYSDNMGTAVLDTNGAEKEAAAKGVYYNPSVDERSGEIIVKIVNESGDELPVSFVKDGKALRTVKVEVLTGEDVSLVNSLEKKEQIKTVTKDELPVMPNHSFAVYRLKEN